MPEDTVVRPSKAAAKAAKFTLGYIEQKIAISHPIGCSRFIMMRVIVDELKQQGQDRPSTRILATKLLLEKLLTRDQLREPLQLRPGLFLTKARREEIRDRLWSDHGCKMIINELQQLRFEQLEEQLDEAKLIKAPGVRLPAVP